MTRKLLVAAAAVGLLFTGTQVASAASSTTIVYNCPTNKEGVRTNVTYTIPTWQVPFWDKELKSRGCTKVS